MWARLVAYLVDFVITLGLLLSLNIIGLIFYPDSSYFDRDVRMTGIEAGIGILVVWSVIFMYPFVTVATWFTTAGKRMFRLYITKTDGKAPGIGRILARSLIYSLYYFLPPLGLILLIASFITIASRKDMRGLHDLICDTMVVKR